MSTLSGQSRRDWRLPAIWLVLFILSIATRTYVAVSDEARHGHVIGIGRPMVDEISSHLIVAGAAAGALLAASPLADRRALQSRDPRRDGGAVQHPAHQRHGRAAAALVQRHRRRALQLSADGRPAAVRIRQGSRHLPDADHRRGGVEFFVAAKVGAVRAPSPSPAARAPVERFAVRQRGGSEIVVEVADIDWIEASGNYAILHVGEETFEIRSSLAKLESELDAKRFVRVHKSHVVNIARASEVIPWVGGDWRIRLRDGAEVNLSRRYRQRFEAVVTVRS